MLALTLVLQDVGQAMSVPRSLWAAIREDMADWSALLIPGLLA